MKKKEDLKDLEIGFLSTDHEDWEYFIRKGYKNIKDVKDYFQKIPFKSLKLSYYKKWNLDKDRILMNNFVRFKKLRTKTIDHWAVQEKYRFIDEIIFKVNRLEYFYQLNRPIHKIIYFFTRLFTYPYNFFIRKKKTFDIIRPVHNIFYYISKFILTSFKPRNIQQTMWKKRIENLNIIAQLNRKKGFGIVSKVALQYFLSYYLILKEINPDLVFIYNGNWLTSTSLTAACEKLDVPHYFTETSSIVGYSHFDSRAVWFDGDINKRVLPKLDAKKERKLEERIREYYKKFKRGIASVAEDDDDVIVRVPERKFIFVPLQMMDDTNNIRYSPLIHHNFQLVKLVLNNPPPEGYDILIKRHPWDTIFADSLYMRALDEIIKYIKNYDNVHLYHYADSQILLKHCSALITMNSSLSMENLLEARVPMVILGDNFVRGWGFTYDVNNLSEYPEKLKEALEKGFTPEKEKKMKQFLYMYMFDFIVKGHYALHYDIIDRDGNAIRQINLPAVYIYLADCIHKELIGVKERIEKGIKRSLPPPETYRCMIDRTQIPNYKGVILDYVHRKY